MSSWNSINKEIIRLSQTRPDAFDIVRRQKMKAVEEITGRPLIIYATDFITPSPIKAQFVGNLMSISLADKDGFDEVTRNITNSSNIDVLLHSPGSSAEQRSLLSRFYEHVSHIFVISSPPWQKALQLC